MFDMHICTYVQANIEKFVHLYVSVQDRYENSDEIFKLKHEFT